MAWILFKLIEKPYYDRNGRILKSIENRKNRFGIDEFFGGGLIYPDLFGYQILERYEHDGELLICFKGDVSDLLTKNTYESYQSVYAVKMPRGKKKIFIAIKRGHDKYNFKDFKATEFSAKDAETKLQQWGLWIEPSESGVTKNGNKKDRPSSLT